MVARLAESLKQLRDEINAKYPGRNKASDGWIGDKAHSGRKSEHNPDANGVVRALDITHDPAHGVDTYAISEFLRQRKDPRILYIISNNRICSPDNQNWAWRPYGGTNPHDHHNHISVRATKALYDDRSPWGISNGTMPVVDAPQPNPVPPTIRKGSPNKELIRKLQTFLKIEVDGLFGKQTEIAVKDLQKSHGITADGIVGPQTWNLVK